MAKHIIIKNLKTEKEYSVTEASWSDMVSKGFGKRFTIVREVISTPNAPSFIPPEVRQAARAASATQDEQPTGRKGSANTRSNA